MKQNSSKEQIIEEEEEEEEIKLKTFKNKIKCLVKNLCQY